MNYLSGQTVLKIREGYEAGLSTRTIGRLLGISKVTVQRYTGMIKKGEFVVPPMKYTKHRRKNVKRISTETAVEPVVEEIVNCEPVKLCVQHSEECKKCMFAEYCIVSGTRISLINGLVAVTKGAQ